VARQEAVAIEQRVVFCVGLDVAQPCRSACGPLMPPAERVGPRRGIVESAPEQHVRNEQLRARSRVRLKGAQTRSCSSPVLVQQTAEQVGPTHSALLILGVNGQPGGLI
jgi:hypothetical protein